MQLNRSTDFALRILMFLACENEAVSIDTISARLNLAKSHTMKIVAKLGTEGLVESQRGRGGGVSLGPEASSINIGSVVRAFEKGFVIVDCFADGAPRCVFQPRCALKSKLHEATKAFLKVLDATTLADVVAGTQKPHLASA